MESSTEAPGGGEKQKKQTSPRGKPLHQPWETRIVNDIVHLHTQRKLMNKVNILQDVGLDLSKLTTKRRIPQQVKSGFSLSGRKVNLKRI